MKIIIPMAGAGKRMRPHTLTTPKPLIPVAGKPIVQWLVEDLTKVCKEKVTEIAFVIGDFGKKAEENLLKIAEKEGAKGKIYYQHEALGTAHAILCAKESMTGKVIIAFADTLFRADFTMDEEKDGVVWVTKVEDAKAFGVVKLDKENIITDFVEKPQTFVSDLAIIGIYYLKDGNNLSKELQYLIDHDIKDKGEFQLTNALENMKKKGLKFAAGKVDEWLDCGNKEAMVHTNRRILEIHRNTKMISSSLKNNNGIIIEPCYIGEDVVIINSVVGPNVSIGSKTVVENSVICNSIIQSNSKVRNAVMNNSMIGNFVEYAGKVNDLSMGDFSVQK